MDGDTDEPAFVLADAVNVNSFSRGVQTNEDGDEARGGHVSERPFDENKMTYGAFCLECNRKYRDPTPDESTMCLHAWKYEVGPFANWLRLFFSLTK